MVHISSTFTAFAALSLSLSLTLVSAHSHALEKRAAGGANCNATYAPVAAGSYPTLDCVPFTQDPQVQAWMKLVDLTKVPVFPQSADGACPPDPNTLPKDQCWWTCQKCEAPDDITSCPTPGTWGLTYDDGPSPESLRLYSNLMEHNQKATLFIVGSRAASYPNTLKQAYNEGHHIAIHTWSHHMMTGLSNEQIVAELKWTEKAIFDTIGVTPIYWRPPFGDVDARVRSIASQLGYKTSMWTQGFDTDDWNIPAGSATPQKVVENFKGFLAKVPTMKTGFIVLQHDIFAQEVDVALNGILPVAYSTKGLTMQPIAQCLNDAKPYKEGAGTFKLVANGTASAGQALAVAGTQTALMAGSSFLDPQVQDWLKLINFTTTPLYPPSKNGLCPDNPATIPAARCWWTCQKCVDSTDIVSCPQTRTWGLTFDDGPSPDSPRLYEYLMSRNQKATFFIVGSRAVSYPATLKRAYTEGHHIAIHTWSHTPMTSLSNEQIVAELKWTEKAIFSVIGVTPLYWRPPYGDVDARVRNIATQLGYKTTIWTHGFDTNDWKIPARLATPQSVIDTFKTWLVMIPSMKAGFIALEHDLFPEEVDVAINGILPLAYVNKTLTMVPIARCLGDAKPYKEGAGTFTT
ncbi:chitin deacetylase [Mortierella alpina]|nr:chitin deacetylase [Mortierella alpina]